MIGPSPYAITHPQARAAVFLAEIEAHSTREDLKAYTQYLNRYQPIPYRLLRLARCLRDAAKLNLFLSQE